MTTCYSENQGNKSKRPYLRCFALNYMFSHGRNCTCVAGSIRRTPFLRHLIILKTEVTSEKSITGHGLPESNRIVSPD
jgi:hypothetical protein